MEELGFMDHTCYHQLSGARQGEGSPFISGPGYQTGPAHTLARAREH
jgi:hypothetical protein